MGFRRPMRSERAPHIGLASAQHTIITEHTEAAQSWLQQGSNLKRFQKFVDDTPDYEAILEMMDEHYDDQDDEDEDDSDKDD